jgi:hypothetical protein
MRSRLKSLLADIGALAIIMGAIVLIVRFAPSNEVPATQRQAAHSAAVEAAIPIQESHSDTTTAEEKKPSESVGAPSTPPKKPEKQEQKGDSVERVREPYRSPPLAFAAVNDATRAALVNILCIPQGKSLSPISGSGVIIDPRGVILTNAHVAQYVLLSESTQIDLACTIRTGAPAAARYLASVLYLPSVWVEKHAPELRDAHPLGSGEHDYALLLIDAMADGNPLPENTGAFPYLSPDTREAIAFQDDQVLVASYPAEFLGGYAATSGLYPASSVTNIGKLLTFSEKSVDLVSLGGVIEAQSGSSGGAVSNAWDRLVGLITTTSEGETTGARDLRAITLSYIDRDLKAQTGSGLGAMLGGDVVSKEQDFRTSAAPDLLRAFIAVLAR